MAKEHIDDLSVSGAGTKMNSNEIVSSLVEAGFTKTQALGISTVIMAIKTGQISIDEAQDFLHSVGFENQLAQDLSHAFFRAMAVAH